MTTLRDEIEHLIERARLYRSCVTCVHFDMTNELCTFQNINVRPPAVVIAKGCEKYIEEPPF